MYIFYLLLQALYPLCLGIGHLVGQPFRMASEPVCLILLTAAAVFLTVRLWDREPSRLANAAPLVSLVNGFCMMLFLDHWGAGLAAVTVTVCGWLISRRAPRGTLKVLCRILSALLTLFLLLLLPVWLFAIGMGHVTVVQELDSPDNRYTAQLIDVDEGALGGGTLVKVRDNDRTVNVLFGSFVREYTVYSGDWGEFQDMELGWTDDGTLRINDGKYTIPNH